MFESDTEENETDKVTMVWAQEEEEKGGAEGGMLRMMEERRRPVGRPRTWRGHVHQDTEELKIEEGLAKDRARWRRIIASLTTSTGEDGNDVNEKDDKDLAVQSSVIWRHAALSGQRNFNFCTITKC